MHFQPLLTEHLVATQRVAATLFPWEQEHRTALAAAVQPGDHREFFAARGLSSLRCWTMHLSAGPVGLATLYGYAAQPDELWLAWFGLMPEARGCGHGRLALDWVIAQAKAEGRRTLRLWTTDEFEYAAAVQLYQGRGFCAESYPALPGEEWNTLVFSLGLDGRRPAPWSAVTDGRELCGREAPSLAVAA